MNRDRAIARLKRAFGEASRDAIAAELDDAMRREVQGGRNIDDAVLDAYDYVSDLLRRGQPLKAAREAQALARRDSSPSQQPQNQPGCQVTRTG